MPRCWWRPETNRALAAAAAQLGGSNWLVAFSGMAEVLGRPVRLPLFALRPPPSAWQLGAALPGRVPHECGMPFAEVRVP
jgi:hypothetical protein